MPNKKKKAPEKRFVALNETSVYRITVECQILDYSDMIESINNNATIIKEEIEREV